MATLARNSPPKAEFPKRGPIGMKTLGKQAKLLKTGFVGHFGQIAKDSFASIPGP